MHDLSTIAWRTARSCAGGNCVQVADVGNGSIAIRDSKNLSGPVLVYTADEWREFLTGAKNGDFDDLTR
jgi:hypothetical protein